MRNFLSGRTARPTIGRVESGELELGGGGTPQGSVLSPFLFNVAMVGLPEILEDIEGLHHNLYADDVTLWVAGGSDGEIQDILQKAIDAVEDYVKPKGRDCSPQKSEFLLYQPTRRGCKGTLSFPKIELYAGGKLIPIVPSIRVLGLRIQANGHCTELVKAIEKSVHQTPRIISRIANQHHGIKGKKFT